MRLVSNELKRKNDEPFPKRFSLPDNPRKDGLMFPCLFCTNNREQTEIPFLDRKEFVAIHLWRNLNWKFLILVLSVQNLGSK